MDLACLHPGVRDQSLFYSQTVGNCVKLFFNRGKSGLKANDTVVCTLHS